MTDADRTAEIEPAREGHVLAGRYELGRRLGAGGMSQVFLARDRELGRTVAVKVLAGGGDVERLRDEARAAASIDHPGVVTVHDVGSTPAGVHVVMSYVDGESLAQRIDRDGPMAPEAVAAVGAAVCDALGAAHRAGVVHRDVSPGNVMLGTDGGVTVTDFGIARIGDGAGRTATGYVIGTPAYLAPEQGRATAELDGRADLYALGCTLFAALTGRPPFTDPDPMSVVLAHVRDAPPRPSELRDGVPDRLERTILRALSKDPRLRHPDAATMAAELAAVSGPDGTREVPAPRRSPDGTAELPVASGIGGAPGGTAGVTAGGDPGGTAELPGGAGGGALDRAVTDVEDDDGAAADRSRTLGFVLLALAVLLVVGVLMATVVV